MYPSWLHGIAPILVIKKVSSLWNKIKFFPTLFHFALHLVWGLLLDLDLDIAILYKWELLIWSCDICSKIMIFFVLEKWNLKQFFKI